MAAGLRLEVEAPLRRRLEDPAAAGADHDVDAVSAAGGEDLGHDLAGLAPVVDVGVAGGRCRVGDRAVRHDAGREPVLLGVLEDRLQDAAVLSAP